MKEKVLTPAGVAHLTEGIKAQIDKKASQSDLETVQSTAGAAQTTANAAQNTASAAIPKVGGATQGDIPTFNASGALADSGVKMSSFTRAKMTLSGTTLTITTVN